MTMFESFERREVATVRGAVNALIGGDGPPLLLLHGFPETHLMWHAVAPVLARRFTVVVPDLPGYGDSFAPEAAPGHEPHSKRAAATTMVELMGALGFERFAVAGHDRGGRVGYRMALDSPSVVTALAVLDIVPTLEVWERADDRLAMAYWHWAFLALPAPRPEQMLLAAPPETFLSHHLERMHAGDLGYPPELVDDYLARLRDPVAVAGMCEDYRAGATVDRALDAADRDAGNRIVCPLLVLWGSRGALPVFYDDVPGIWRGWIDAAPGHFSAEPVDATHYIPEDAPVETAELLDAFCAD